MSIDKNKTTALTVEVQLRDTEVFNKMLDILKDITEDNNIDITIRERYRKRILDIIE